MSRKLNNRSKMTQEENEVKLLYKALRECQDGTRICDNLIRHIELQEMQVKAIIAQENAMKVAEEATVSAERIASKAAVSANKVLVKKEAEMKDEIKVKNELLNETSEDDDLVLIKNELVECQEFLDVDAETEFLSENSAETDVVIVNKNDAELEQKLLAPIVELIVPKFEKENPAEINQQKLLLARNEESNVKFKYEMEDD